MDDKTRDPLRLCEFLLEQCLAQGVTLHHPARATELVRANRKDPRSPTFIRLQYLDHKSKFVDIPCGSVVIAAGCWTPKVYKTLFPNASRMPRVTPLAGHSIIMKTKRWTSLIAAGKLPKPKIPIPPVPAVITLPNGNSMSTQPMEGHQESGGSSSDTTPQDEHGRSLLRRDDALTTVRAAKLNQVIAAVEGAERKTRSTTARPRKSTLCHAIFTSDPSGFSPEIFSRAGGDVWLGGLNSSSILLPALPTAWKDIISRDSIQTLINVGKSLCGEDVEIVSEGLCFRPVSPTGKPIIAKVHEADLGDGVKLGRESDGKVKGVFVATGHGPWGISLSLGTGKVMAEMILGRKTSVDVSALGTWEAQAP